MASCIKRRCALCKKKKSPSNFTKNPDSGRSFRTCVDCKMAQHFAKVHGPKKCESCKKMRLSRCYAKDAAGYLYGDCIYCTRSYKSKECSRCKSVMKVSKFARDERGRISNECIPCKKELIHHEKDFYRSVRIESRAGMVYYNLY